MADAKERTNRILAIAFRMFEIGAGLREVVMALHLTPGQVRELYADFKRSLYGPQQS
jgi:hypothetical protein